MVVPTSSTRIVRGRNMLNLVLVLPVRIILTRMHLYPVGNMMLMSMGNPAGFTTETESGTGQKECRPDRSSKYLCPFLSAHGAEGVYPAELSLHSPMWKRSR